MICGTRVELRVDDILTERPRGTACADERCQVATTNEARNDGGTEIENAPMPPWS